MNAEARFLPSRSRSGSMLLVAMGLAVACTALAMGFLAIARQSVTGGRDLQLANLAEQAARAGTAHAFSATLRSYVACAGSSTSYGPTTYRQAWSLGFRAIDSLDEGADTATNTFDDERFGRAGSRFDDNGNDVAVDEQLFDPQATFYNHTDQRSRILSDGTLRTHGVGRWIEPGYHHSDLVGKPTSFHLNQLTADRTTPVGNDPAIHYLPDTPDRASYLDEDLQPVPASARQTARYRLRYAVAIEDLAGHLAFNTPGTYQVPGAYPISEAAGYAHREVDYDRCLRFFPGMAALAMSPAQTWNYWPLEYMLHGVNAFNWTSESPSTNKSLATFSGTLPNGTSMPGSPSYWDDFGIGAPSEGIHDNPRTAFINTSATATANRFFATWAGPLITFEPFRNLQTNQAVSAQRGFVYSPFSPRLQQVAAGATPQDGNETWNGCDHPVQINIPTMTVDTLLMMLFAHLPQEARTFRYSTPVWFRGNADGSWTNRGQVTAPPADVPAPGWAVTAAAEAAAGNLQIEHAGARFRQLLTDWDDAYPVVDALTEWSPTLGQNIDLSNKTRSDPLFDADFSGQPMFSGVVPGQSTRLTYRPEVNVTHTDNTQTWMLQIQPAAGGNLNSLHSGTTLNTFVVNPYSYWWDLHTALMHALLVTAAVWHGDDGTGALAWKKGQPGNLAWPSPTPIGSAGTNVLDRDADGDGINDTPQHLDSIEEVDRLFLRNLGEKFGTPNPADIQKGLRLWRRTGGTATTVPGWDANHGRAVVLDEFQSNNTIKALLDAGSITANQANSMELVLNDTRLSFFGSSPQYPGFRPIDFDGNATVWCSGYTAAGGTRYRRAAIGGGFGPAVDQRFCLTGTFVFRPSRNYRAFVRGEVFDQLKGRPAAEALLDSAFLIDADASLFRADGSPSADWRADPTACIGLEDNAFLYQRWLRSGYMLNNLVPVLP